MSADAPLAEFALGSGALSGSRLTLYPNRIVHTSGDAMETVPLAQLAAVGVAFQRDPRKLNWAITLLVLALILAAISSPLRDWLLGIAGKLGDGRRESLDAVLFAVFGALAALARLLLPLAGVLAAGAAALAAFFWIGVTALTLSFGPSEREFAVRGRNFQLIDFAHTVGQQLAARKP